MDVAVDRDTTWLKESRLTKAAAVRGLAKNGEGGRVVVVVVVAVAEDVEAAVLLEGVTNFLDRGDSR